MNIDGLSEYQILNVMQQMLVYSNACYIHQWNQEHTILAITVGFTGQLNGWWHDYLSEIQGEEILKSIKRDDTGHPILNERGETQGDQVLALITNIIHHFLGKLQDVSKKNKEQLINLKCHTLTDFQWYKDVYPSKLFRIDNYDSSFWKENFISGLPTLFAEKIRNFVCEKGNGSLNYNQYTYGKLIQIINKVGLSICTDLKLRHQMRKERSNNLKELGNFCYQFGYDPIISPPRRTTSKSHINKTSFFPKRQRHPKYRHNPRSKTKAEPPNDSKPHINDPQRCYKCNKPGHFANKCFAKTTKKKLNNIENKSNSENSDNNSDQENMCHSCQDSFSEYESSSTPSINMLPANEKLIL
eukprot:TRINITY_DN19751_c0_g2_i1.p1 TRINITY_DN19751_c0_g2~~TRINITY_DN19751_c0_g2_i1.p1  ORF type:complete len:357 (+),score=5.83 TRINITY_DN19751_c0_g2_i1:1358-2428(+)